MLRTLVILLLIPLAAPAEEFLDAPTGIKIDVPDGWKRDANREKASVRFFAMHSVERGKYVSFAVEAVSAANFGADDWLENEKKVKTGKYLAEVDQAFKKIPDAKVGGLDAVAYTCGGKGKMRGHDGHVHFRVYGVVHGEMFIQITEFSYNKAHEAAADKLKELWDGISFEEGEGDGLDGADGADGGAGGDLSKGVPAAEGKPTSVEDKVGNYKTTLPPGWEVGREAEAADTQLRMIFVRKFNDNVICEIQVWRVPLGDPTIFNTGTPDEVLQRVFNKNSKFFEPFYGEGSSEMIHPQTDEGAGFGSAEKSGSYEVRSITTQEMAKVAAAEQKIRKGIKGVTVPKFKDLVIRGRLAMISPNVYLTRAIFARNLADDPQLLAEFNKIHDDLAFLVTKALPPQLNIRGENAGNTLEDPDLAKPRKEKAIVTRIGRKTYQVEFSFTLPPGFKAKVEKLGGDTAFIVWAQDKLNNWVMIDVLTINLKKWSEENKRHEKDSSFNTWKSNWTGKARGAKVPSKPQKFSLGKARGEGYKLLKGDVEGFPGTFQGVVSDKFPGKGWRTMITVETRGDNIFADSIKKFLKSVKAKDIKAR